MNCPLTQAVKVCHWFDGTKKMESCRCKQGLGKQSEKVTRISPSHTQVNKPDPKLHPNLDIDLANGIDGVSDGDILNLSDSEHELPNDGEVEGHGDAAHTGDM